jgi:hypothetical protein
VGRKAFGVVLNLTGALSPELSVDRNTIRELVDRTAVDDLLRAATPALVADESFGITRPWLNGFTYEFPIAADAVWQALRDRDGGVSLDGAAAAVPVDRIGYLPLDGELLPAPNPQLHSGLLYSLMSDALVHSRVLAWSGGAGAYGHDGGAPPAAVPSDLVIVGLDEDSGYPTPLFSALSWVAHIAGRMRRPFPYVRERLRALGLSMMSGKALTRSVIPRTTCWSCRGRWTAAPRSSDPTSRSGRSCWRHSVWGVTRRRSPGSCVRWDFPSPRGASSRDACDPWTSFCSAGI